MRRGAAGPKDRDGGPPGRTPGEEQGVPEKLGALRARVLAALEREGLLLRRRGGAAAADERKLLPGQG
ncbi:MAG TPA: hypothetical protein VND93_26765 [Myxococcales bacterium]|jgi:hypothetical protein|nr:hypothetical protein [Myxococcales bacterium]